MFGYPAEGESSRDTLAELIRIIHEDRDSGEKSTKFSTNRQSAMPTAIYLFDPCALGRQCLIADLDIDYESFDLARGPYLHPAFAFRTLDAGVSAAVHGPR